MRVDEAATPNDETPNDQQAAELDQAAEADFVSGYEKPSTDDDESPAASTRAEGEPAQAAAPDSAPSGGEGADDKAPTDNGEGSEPNADDEIVFEGLTRSQLKAAIVAATEVPELRKEIARVNDRAFGKIGEVLENVKKLTEGGLTAKARKITKENLAKTMAEYPEIAELLAEDLSGIVLQAEAPAPAKDEAPLELDAREKARERAILTAAHRDWRALRDTEDFKLWKSTLPQEAVNVLNTTYDAETLIEAFDDFKAWRDKAAQAKRDAEAAASKAKTHRLAAASVPKGSPAPSEAPPDEDAALEAGWKAAGG